MDNSTQPNENLMKYLDGELSGAEKEDLEKRLATDPGLRQELEDLQTARAGVRMYGLRQYVGSIHQQMMVEMKPHATVRSLRPMRRVIRYSISIAASILFLAFCVFGYNVLTLSPGKLYNSEYHPYEMPAVRGESQVSHLEKSYQLHHYNEVIEDLQKEPSPSQSDLFLTGIAYLETSKVSSAIDAFKSVLEKNRAQKSSVFNDDAEYYLALSYLRNKNYDQALDLIRTIRNNADHLYHDQFTASFVRKVKMLKWR